MDGKDGTVGHKDKTVLQLLNACDGQFKPIASAGMG